jgi:hypothetical protein
MTRRDNDLGGTSHEQSHSSGSVRMRVAERLKRIAEVASGSSDVPGVSHSQSFSHTRPVASSLKEAVESELEAFELTDQRHDQYHSQTSIS